MDKKQNISHIVTSALCVSCGACKGVCPVSAITFSETPGGSYFPRVDKKLCTFCGLCEAVCPALHRGKSLKERMPADPFIGQALESYSGIATDKTVYENSQSGGIVSALLLHALESGQIEAAVTVMMQSGNPPRPQVIIARNKNDILSAQKSKYCPVSLLELIPEIRKIKGKVAFVGVSCQIRGLMNVLDEVTDLRDKIAFTLGLVCDRTMTFGGLDYLVRKASPGTDKELCMHFRDKNVSGYPGNVHVFSSGGYSRVLPASERIRIKDPFTPPACRICYDKMNVFSDITVGDPHGIKGIDRKGGESMIIVRTKRGEDVLHKQLSAGNISLRSADREAILKGQKIDKKRKDWRGYLEAWKETQRECPQFDDAVLNNSLKPGNIETYKRSLDFAFRLDEYAARGELFDLVEEQLKRKKRNKLLSLPVRMMKKVFKGLGV